MQKLEDIKLAIIGLGYVGLPLAVEFGKQRSVVGFDINQPRIQALKAGNDSTLEVSDEELKQASHLSFSSDLAELAACNTFVVTVPTPIDEYNQPDLTPLIKASESIGKVLKKGDLVIYESRKGFKGLFIELKKDMQSLFNKNGSYKKSNPIPIDKSFNPI